jgi:3-methylcrotonyl-CoA carboxylase alpha subunit
MSLRRPDYANAIEGLAAGDDIRAPMPGKIIEVRASPGQTVKRGDTLAVMEAMKMEHALSAPRDGVVALVHAAVGVQTIEGAVLVSLEPLA